MRTVLRAGLLALALVALAPAPARAGHILVSPPNPADFFEFGTGTTVTAYSVIWDGNQLPINEIQVQWRNRRTGAQFSYYFDYNGPNGGSFSTICPVPFRHQLPPTGTGFEEYEMYVYGNYRGPSSRVLIQRSYVIPYLTIW